MKWKLILITWISFLVPRAVSSLEGHYHEQQPLRDAHAPTVENPSGIYRGLINSTAPNVRQFLGVPFAKPPTGDLRWAPPQRLDYNGTQNYDATKFPPSCPQYVTKDPNVYNQATPEFLISGPISEDCLALSIWTPIEAQGLPVIVYITGGAFITGGVEIQYQLPYNWVERTQSHVAVTINYRLNIFGFPNAADLEDQNLGILDQRMALEWVKDNIEAFGGDPQKITLWGQSAGAASVDHHNFAFASDPIFTGFIATSGSSLIGISTPDKIHSNFTYIARQLNCDKLTPSEELACMRQIPWEEIISTAGPLIHSYDKIFFYPIPDEKVIFSNYTSRYQHGQFSKRPAIFSTTREEGIVIPPFHEDGVDNEMATQFTNSLFLCPASETTRLRTAAGAKTYRYLYSGNFSNISPLRWVGACHNADLPMIFGTHSDFRGKSTDFQKDVSKQMQDLVLAFMSDPHDGLEKLGWKEAGRSGKMLEFGGDGDIVKNVEIKDVEDVCKDGGGWKW